MLPRHKTPAYYPGMSTKRCSHSLWCAVVPVLLSVTTGCGSPKVLALTPHGFFEHEAYPMRVGYGSYEVPGEILGADWRLENFQYDDGVPKKRKRTPQYVDEFLYDKNDDGDEDDAIPWTRYDLRYENRKTAARIVLWTSPLSSHDEHLEARVLARNLAEAFGLELRALTGDFREGKIAVFTSGRTIAAATREEAACTFGDSQAHRIDLDLADVDQIKIDPERRFRRVRLVVSHTPMAWLKHGRDAESSMPVVLIGMLVSRPEDFDQHIGDFEKLMGEIGLGTGFAGTPPSMPSGLRCRPLPAPAMEPKAEPGNASAPSDPEPDPKPVEAESPEEPVAPSRHEEGP